MAGRRALQLRSLRQGDGLRHELEPDRRQPISAGIDNTIFYAGETFDSSTGLYFDRARYYDPQLGRFISQDPMGYAGSGANLYAYCGDNPTDATDPSGMVDRPAKPFEYVPGAVNMRIGRPNRMRSSDLLQAEMAANAQPSAVCLYARIATERSVRTAQKSGGSKSRRDICPSRHHLFRWHGRWPMAQR